MAHPFFDEITFPFHLREAQELEAVLILVYDNRDAITHLCDMCGLNRSELNIEQAPAPLWREALKLFARQARVKSLCERVGRSFQGTPRVVKAIQAVFDAEDPRKQVYAADRMLVLNRKSLREKLSEFEVSDSPIRVLLVRGEAKSGKSHGRYLFFRIATSLGAQPIYLHRARVSTVPVAVDTIFAALGLPNTAPPQGDSTKVAWYQAICREILRQTAHSGIRAWIAVDDLGLDANGQPLLDPDIKLFFDEFAAFMNTPQFQSRFWLLLIHYPDGEVPTHWEEGFWLEDRTSTGDLTLDDVAEALREGIKRQGLVGLEDQIKADAEQVIRTADTLAPSARLKGINTDVKNRLTNLTTP
ncbi:hypothetical protein DES53_111162 [Roseimicrobium gellanilyticum]|uniref:Uncharacterized protein n=1 Tax=Roseimicrobium gellanilyticum TaxID=748857 RepID=A0A366HAN3_9BACT|nr:hypothetical protein [Roseimicrobium gellanilyticum]RBP38642.1 hypothetical protein DES53_111162 [Roseimicrobium gellanilyticum]